MKGLSITGFLCWIIISSAALAATGAEFSLQDMLAESAPEKPIEVRVGVQVEQIKFVDQRSENFGVVANLRMEWFDPVLAYDASGDKKKFRTYRLNDFVAYTDRNNLFMPGYIIDNQQGRKLSQVAIVIVAPDGHAFLFERFAPTLQAPNFNFTRYPFDTQTFSLQVSSAQPSEFVRLMPLQGYSRMGDYLGEEEWMVTSFSTGVERVRGITGLYNDRFSLTFRARRHHDYYILRIFIPLVIFMLVAWVTFFLQDFSKRIDVASSNLLIFIAFNFAISSELPRLGYITFIDFLLVSMFLMTGLVVIYNVVLRKMEINGQEHLARRMDIYVLVGIYPLLYLLIIGFGTLNYLYTAG